VKDMMAADLAVVKGEKQDHDAPRL
jgi:hypothetical protein